jgi:hypothetical protein
LSKKDLNPSISSFFIFMGWASDPDHSGWNPVKRKQRMMGGLRTSDA